MESSRAQIMPHSLETPYTSQAMSLWETPEEHMVTHYDLIPRVSQLKTSSSLQTTTLRRGGEQMINLQSESMMKMIYKS